MTGVRCIDSYWIFSRQVERPLYPILCCLFSYEKCLFARLLAPVSTIKIFGYVFIHDIEIRLLWETNSETVFLPHVFMLMNEKSGANRFRKDVLWQQIRFVAWLELYPRRGFYSSNLRTELGLLWAHDICLSWSESGVRSHWTCGFSSANSHWSMCQGNILFCSSHFTRITKANFVVIVTLRSSPSLEMGIPQG